MALLNIFKKKKKAEEKISKAEKAPKAEKKESYEAKPHKISGIAYRILKRPHVTEKATDLTSKNQYVFEVSQQANKPEIKKAIEDVYGVEVEKVRIINIPRKKRILRGIRGWRGGYKKAIVRIKEGQKIEVLPR